MGDQIHQLFSGDLRIATVIVDSDGRITFFGPHAETLTGFRRAEIIGRDIQLLSGGTLSFDLDAGPTTATGMPEIHQIRRADGSTRAVVTYRHPIPHTDRPPSTLIMAVDVAESTETQVSLGMLNAFFQQAGVGFAILDTQLRFVALNEALADINRRPIVDHLGRHVHEVIDSADFETYEALLHTVLRTGDPVLNLRVPGFPTNSPGDSQVWSVSWCRMMEPGNQPLGLCGIIMDITADEHPTLDAERNRARLSLLSRIGVTQGATLDFHQTAQDLAKLLVKDYCDMVTVDVLHDIVTGERPPTEADADTLISRIGAASRKRSGLIYRLMQVDNPRPASRTDAFARVLTTNRPQLLQQPSVTEAPVIGQDPFRSAAAVELGIQSIIVAPLRARDTTLGALTCVRFKDREPFNDDDVLLVSEIADRTALNIDNSRLYRDEKQAALTLQLSLLPRSLPNLPELGLTFRYRPNRTDLRAGGDWFDTIKLPGRRVALVVGDVAGHGIHSAATMGHYRTAVRTLASIGLDPASLLTRLNDVSTDFGDDATATCIVVMYDPVQNWCVMASAGHPPPIIAMPGEAAETREVAGGPVLGAISEAEYSATALTTPPGTRLLLYSDGVVEARGKGSDAGIANLVRHMQNRQPATQLCDEVMAESPSAEDDRTVLLAELRGFNPREST